MNREDYLQFCRYYKGEDSNPYDGKDNNKAMLWFYESAWLHEMKEIQQDEKQEKEHTLFVYIDEYVNCGLGDFEKTDDIPISLKALLFNRYARGSYSMQDAIKPFKTFYKKYY